MSAATTQVNTAHANSAGKPKKAKAGRPLGTGRYGVPTKVVRVPEHLVDNIQVFAEADGFQLPFFDTPVQAGTPTAVADAKPDSKMDLLRYLVVNPKDTILLVAHGESMIDVGIHSGDLMIVDRKREARNNDIVIASVDDSFTVKRLEITKQGARLMPENKNFKPVEINEGNNVQLWGVVSHCIHRY